MKEIPLNTKRLIIKPLSDTELLGRIETEKDEHMRAALEEMHSGCITKPERRLWYTLWTIVLKGGGEIGSLCFKGLRKAGSEIGYGIDEAYRGQGYGAEAVKAATDWALDQKDVYFVTAIPENEASEKLLRSLGFVPSESAPDVLEKEKPLKSLTAIYIGCGLCMGLVLGLAMDNQALGMPIGLCLGVAVGSMLDAAERKKRQEIKKIRKKAEK